MSKRLAIAFILFCTLSLGFNSAPTSADILAIAPDSTIAKLATFHDIAEVREAISRIRQGDYVTAVPILKKYTLKNDIGATFVLAKLHQFGIGVEKSEQIAAGYLKANVDAGHAPSLIALGEVRESSNPAEAISIYKKAVANGDPTGNLKLGDIYERGLLGRRANPKLAFTNYEKAAKAENPIGHYHLARCYDKGIGTSPNALLATRTFLKAALKGMPNAQVMMARRYYEGAGLEKDPIAAVGWLSLASQSGSTEAMVLLGQRYEVGDIIPQNLALAGQLYSNAAKRGDPTGKFFLAVMYANGKGTKQDLVRAYVLLAGCAESLPKAKTALEELEKKLSPNQKILVEKKLADAKAKSANSTGNVQK